MTSRLAPQFWAELQRGLEHEQAALVASRPGEGRGRQPVSVLYGGAHLFSASIPAKLGALAQRALQSFAPDAASFARAFELPEPLAVRVFSRVQAKLAREPLEDLRIDFEDGFGHRPDAEEDELARRAGLELAQAQGLPPFVGVRIKPLSQELGVRAVRTLELFLGSLEALPPGFVVTLPKVVTLGQVRLLLGALEALERARGWATGSLRFEVMVESAEGLIDAEGRELLPQLRALAGARLRGAHFGTYDYTASLGITAAEQRLCHPACDHAKALMQRAFAGTGVWLSDGATTTLPIAPHRGEALSEHQQHENRDAVHAAWRQSFVDTTHSLTHGFYQGWDLHPAQLVSRYAAVYTFFARSLEPATARLRQFVGQLGQATRVGTSFDDAATGQGLLNFFLRGLACGALDPAEVLATGLTHEELLGRSFAKIAAGRRG